MNSIIERIASFADIDTRRALGIYRKLPKTDADFTFRKLHPTTFRYFPASRKLLYINFNPSYDVYCWEIYDDIEPMGDAWFQAGNGRHRGVWHGLDDFMYFDTQARYACPIHFAGVPDVIT